MTGAEIALLIAATATASYSAYQQGQTAARQAKAEAAWMDYNAKVAQKEADSERQAAEFESQQHQRQSEQLLKRHRALVGKSGVTMEGSPLLVMEDTAAQLTLENAMIRQQGLRRSEAYRSQSILDFAKSRFTNKSAKGYSQAGTIRAGSSLLEGGSKLAYMKSQSSKGSE